MRFDGAVLAGGASVRMGRDKALIEIDDGRRLGQRAIDAVDAAGARLVRVVGGDPALAMLSGKLHVADDYPGEGPLGGVITALRTSTEDVVFVMACDVPGATAQAVLRTLSSLGRHDVAVPLTGDVAQPLHGAWRRQALSHLLRVFEAGERSITRALSGLDVVLVAGFEEGSLSDVDEPDDFERLGVTVVGRSELPSPGTEPGK